MAIDKNEIPIGEGGGLNKVDYQKLQTINGGGKVIVIPNGKVKIISSVSPESQLTDFYNKATKAVPETTPRLIDEANPSVIRESAEAGAKLADDIPTQAADDVPVKNMDEAELDVIIKEKAPINMSKFGLTYEDKLAFVKFLDGAGDTLKTTACRCPTTFTSRRRIAT